MADRSTAQNHVTKLVKAFGLETESNNSNSSMRNRSTRNAALAAKNTSKAVPGDNSNKKSGSLPKLSIEKSGLIEKKMEDFKSEVMVKNSNLNEASDKRECNTSFPKWVQMEPCMSWNFLSPEKMATCQKKVGPIGVLSKNTQENLLINDILFCLSGISGEYIKILPNSKGPEELSIVIDESSDPSLLELTKRLFPIFHNYFIIMKFIDERCEFKYGLVNHALCSAIRHLMKDYFILIAQLEQQHLQNNMSLQKMWFYLQPCMSKLNTIAVIATILTKNDSHGGEVLSVIHEQAISIGEDSAQEICTHLAQAASVPYFNLLEKWIYKGIISDLYSEFLVKDNEPVAKDSLMVEYSDDYWEKRYTIQSRLIPKFLEKVTDMILCTGKYLNVIRQCGRDIKCPSAKQITYVVREQYYFDIIQNAYSFASQKLLDLLMDDNDLMGRLRSLKHYYFLDQADFVIQFADMAEEELRKKIDDIIPNRLESLLELALRTSVVNADKYKDDIKVVFIPHDLLTQLSEIHKIQQNVKEGNTNITGVESFAFDYDVKWPISLVINKTALSYYRLLFRHLFYCKHVEGLLGKVWTLNKIAKSYPAQVASSYSSAFALRQQMLNFIQSLYYYMTLEVIEPYWQLFRTRIQEVSNVDEVIKCHIDFLESCLMDCMLTSPSVFQILHKLIQLCVSFSHFMQKTHKAAIEAEFSGMDDRCLMPLYEDVHFSPKKIVSGMESPSLRLSFQQQIQNFQKEFDAKFLQLVKHSHEYRQLTTMVNMLSRLDFNGFYMKFQQAAEAKE